ncbi:hypothetical protein JCM10213_004954 [Rhodosporidiobolus nylandii]
MAPSLLQTLLREPTRRYQDGPSPSSYSSSSRPSSLRSSRSVGSYSSDAGGAVREPAWTNGEWDWGKFGGRAGLTGGPRSLHTPSVVGRSLGLGAEQPGRRASSLRSASGYADDQGSVRSGRSGRSVRSGMSDDSARTNMSVPGLGGMDGRSGRKKHSSKRSSSSLAQVPEYAYAPSAPSSSRSRTQSYGSEPAQRYTTSSSSTGSYPRHSGEQTSRRYSSMSALPSTGYPSSNLSGVSSSSTSRRSKSKSPIPRFPSDDTQTPSLTSSASSAPSSPPQTPVQPTQPGLPHLPLDGSRPKKGKEKQRPQSLSVEEAVMQVGRPAPKPERVVLEEPVTAAQEGSIPSPTAAPRPSSPSPAPVPVPGKFYSVDELFALASPSPAGPTPSSASEPSAPALDREPNESASSAGTFATALSSPLPTAVTAPRLARQESDNASFATALDFSAPVAPPALVVPRLRLTRTHSDQERVGNRGSVELVVDEEEGIAEEASEEEASSEISEEEVDSGSVVEYAEEDDVVPPAPAPAPIPALEQPQREEPQLARFVEAKRTKRKSGSTTSSRPRSVLSTSPSRAYAHEVVKSSSPGRPSSLSLSVDASVRSASPTSSVGGRSDVSSASASTSTSTTTTAAADVPDWLKRVRALGEPLDAPLLTPSAPPRRERRQRELSAPPAHWTVQQLRERDQSSGSGPRPPINRPRSVGSLRARARVMKEVPEEKEAEELAAAEEEGRQVTPAWVRRKDGLGVPASSASARSASPISFTSTAGSSTRRSRSVDLSSADRDRLSLMKPTSPLSRSTSLTSSSSSAGSRTYTAADIEAIAASATHRPPPKGLLAKLLQPQVPLASSKAVREEPPARVVKNECPRSEHEIGRLEGYRVPSPGPARAQSLRDFTNSSPVRSRPSSLRELVRPAPAVPEEDEEEEEDARSIGDRSELSTMSAPQLSPVRPPRNPARKGSMDMQAPPVPEIPLEHQRFPPAAAPSPESIPLPPSRPTSILSTAPRQREEETRTSPRPLSRSFSEVERPSMHGARSELPPPMPILPLLSRPVSPSPSAAASAAPSAVPSSIRPFSSLLDPSSSTPAGTGAACALALSPRIDFGKKKTSRRFGLFKRSSHADLSSASPSSRRFIPDNDLVYEPFDTAAATKRIKSDEVLVEVIAVGVDRWDRERVWQVAKGMGGAGFVPGRALVGKVAEGGEGVKGLKKGELVWGLNSVKKSSALASFVTLARDHVALAPSLPSLPVEHLATLPATATAAMLIMSSLAGSLPKGSKVLVLNAHQGIGHLCLQLAAFLRPASGGVGARDLWMVAQCPMAVNEGEALCMEVGATEVVRDEPLAAINGQHEGSFDVVVDTIGGRRLYDASRRILHHSGQFITTVGDSLTPSFSSPSTTGSSENFRSLRRAFFKKDKKQVSYWRVNPDADERDSARDTLDRVREAVDAGALKPQVGRVISFAEARAAFSEGQAEVEGTVVKVKEV